MKTTEELEAEILILKKQCDEYEEELQKDVRHIIYIEGELDRKRVEYERLRDDFKIETKRRIKAENEVMLLKKTIEKKSTTLVKQEREFLDEDICGRKEIQTIVDEHGKQRMKELNNMAGAEIAKRLAESTVLRGNTMEKENRDGTGRFYLIEKIKDENDRQIGATERTAEREQNSKATREENPTRRNQSLIEEDIAEEMARKRKTRGGKYKRERDEFYRIKRTNKNFQRGDSHDGNGRPYERRSETSRVYKRNEDSLRYVYQRRSDNYLGDQKQSSAVSNNFDYAHDIAQRRRYNNP